MSTGLSLDNSINKYSSKLNNSPQAPATRQPANFETKADEFVRPNPEHKKLADSKAASTAKNIILAAGMALGVAAVTAAIFFKKKPLGNFAEHIDFIQASTMEEAKAFAQKNFGVKKYFFENDLEFANWVNEGLTNANNRFKGKARMPKIIGFAPDAVEALHKDASAVSFGRFDTILFSKNYFNKQRLIEEFADLADGLFRINEDGDLVMSYSRLIPSKELEEVGKIWKQFDKDPNSLTRFDLRNVALKLEDCLTNYVDPQMAFYKISDNEKMVNKIKKAGYDLDINKFLKLDKNEQISLLDEMLDKADIKFKKGYMRNNSRFDDVYHEMGHLEHQTTEATIFDLLFGKLSKRNKEFLNNANEQRIAGKISWYAKTEPQEFVAETFNAIVAGKKIPEEVMELYKKYNGPMTAML